MGKTKLEKLADQFRIDNTKANTYLPGSGKEYSQGHPNALSDGDDKGRGTNSNSDLLNTTNGGNNIAIGGYAGFNEFSSNNFYLDNFR